MKTLCRKTKQAEAALPAADATEAACVKNNHQWDATDGRCRRAAEEDAGCLCLRRYRYVKDALNIQTFMGRKNQQWVQFQREMWRDGFKSVFYLKKKKNNYKIYRFPHVLSWLVRSDLLSYKFIFHGHGLQLWMQLCWLRLVHTECIMVMRAEKEEEEVWNLKPWRQKLKLE